MKYRVLSNQEAYSWISHAHLRDTFEDKWLSESQVSGVGYDKLQLISPMGMLLTTLPYSSYVSTEPEQEFNWDLERWLGDYRSYTVTPKQEKNYNRYGKQ